MMDRRSTLRLTLGLAAVALAGCASMTGRDPVQVQVVGVEPLQGEGLELRFLTKLRVQNPNDAPIEYSGIYVDLEVRGNSFATGVSDAAGTVPRYGEVVLEVPVTASALRIVRQVVGIYGSGATRLDYVMRGKIGGSAFSAVRFESKGQLELPTGMAPAQ